MAVKVKICGLTNLTDAQVALEAGADFLGFILYAKSPRYIAPDQLAQLLSALELPKPVQSVGVFVNTPVDQVRAILAQTGLHLAQLHGDEPVTAVAQLDGHGYKAIRPADATAAASARDFISYPNDDSPQLLLDAYHPTAYGGTGHQADWAMAATVAKTTPRMLLAGGLTVENVQDAVATVAPWGVDVASGVESSPGRKDHAQVRAFVANARRTL